MVAERKARIVRCVVRDVVDIEPAAAVEDIVVEVARGLDSESTVGFKCYMGAGAIPFKSENRKILF